MNDNEYKFNKFLYDAGRCQQMISEAVDVFNQISFEDEDFTLEQLQFLSKIQNYLHAINSLLVYE